jgi:ribosomal protein L12E/L44/L45/RPP1/RPP2
MLIKLIISRVAVRALPSPNPPATPPVLHVPLEEESESSEEEESEEEEEEEEENVVRGLTPSAPPATLTAEKKTGTLPLGMH